MEQKEDLAKISERLSRLEMHINELVGENRTLHHEIERIKQKTHTINGPTIDL
jgi:regulator of replication initiation timing